MTAVVVMHGWELENGAHLRHGEAPVRRGLSGAIS